MIKEAVIDMIKEAQTLKATDIHFNQNSDDETVTIKMRAGNVMIPQATIDFKQYEQILSYVRFNASMDLQQPMQPQSGSLVIEADEDLLNCRVSVLPTAKFPSLVLRITGVKFGKSLDDLPLFPRNATLLKDLSKLDSGLILIGGSTGCGKTTTAYALIAELKQQGKSVITIEDPIEYQQPDIIRMQVGNLPKMSKIPEISEMPKIPDKSLKIDKSPKAKPKPAKPTEDVGMDYTAGIKEILRHDPDVIVIGEIRDAKTAKQAIRASLSGHLVISTIHSMK